MSTRARAIAAEIAADARNAAAKDAGAERAKPKLKRYDIAYAYDVPYYVDFTIDATSEREALRIARRALKEGRFASVSGEPCYDNAHNDRVFSMGRAQDDTEENAMENLPDFEREDVPKKQAGSLRMVLAAWLAAIALAAALSPFFGASLVHAQSEALCETDTECMAFCPPDDPDCDGGPQ